MINASSTAAYTFDSAVYSDLFKDVYGFRPRGKDVFSWSSKIDSEKQAEWDGLVKAAEKAIDQERQDEEMAAEAFEAKIENLIASGANNRSTAIRWLMDAHDCGNDSDYLEFQLGLPYGYLSG